MKRNIFFCPVLANVESENRYTVKIPQGETLFLACETSTAMQRMLHGSRRAFSMRLYDQTRQEAMSFVRRLAFSNFCCGCYLQVIKLHGQFVIFTEKCFPL